MGNSGRLTRVRLQQPQEQRYPVLQVHRWVFSCFRNPPNSDMDYGICNVRMEIFLWKYVWHSETDVYIAGKIFLCTVIWCIICPDQLRGITVMCVRRACKKHKMWPWAKIICRFDVSLVRSSLWSAITGYYTLSLAVSGQSSHIWALARVTSRLWPAVHLGFGRLSLLFLRCTLLYAVCHAINYVATTLILLVTASLSERLEWLLQSNLHHHNNIATSTPLTTFRYIIFTSMIQCMIFCSI